MEENIRLLYEYFIITYNKVIPNILLTFLLISGGISIILFFNKLFLGVVIFGNYVVRA